MTVGKALTDAEVAQIRKLFREIGVGTQVAEMVGVSPSVNAAIRLAVADMLRRRAAPAHAINGVRQPAVNIPSTWIAEAIYGAVNGVSFDLVMDDAIMASPGCMAVLGSITYA